MKLLEVKVHYCEVEVTHMSSQFKKIMNSLRKFMKLVEHFDDIDWKVHELAWNLHEVEFALCKVIFPKEYIYEDLLVKCFATWEFGCTYQPSHKFVLEKQRDGDVPKLPS